MKPYPQQEIEDSREETTEEPLDYMKMTQDWVAKTPTIEECLAALRKDESKIKIPIIEYERAEWEPEIVHTPSWPRWLAFIFLIAAILVYFR
jgi:hypothetical protein